MKAADVKRIRTKFRNVDIKSGLEPGSDECTVAVCFSIAQTLETKQGRNTVSGKRSNIA